MRILILGAVSASTGNAPADDTPTWLAEVRGQILLERLVEKCAPLAANKMIFAMNASDIRKYRLDSIIALAAPEASIIQVTRDTQGAACTALLATPHIDCNDQLLIINSNEFLDIDYLNAIKNLRDRELDAGVVVFSSIHPRYSYIRLNENGFIVEASEKRPISRHATAGFYWYRSGADFVGAVKEMIRKDAQVDGLFYICPVFNELVLRQKKMGALEVDAKLYHPLKSRRQITLYENEGVAEQGR